MIHEILNRAEAHQAEGRLDLAIAEYSEAIRVDPKHAGAHFGRGMCYGKKGDLHTARLDFDETTRLNPRHAEAFINRGYCWFTMGQHQRAITDYEWALRINPRQVEAINNRGVAWREMGEYDKAIADFKAVLAIDPKHDLAPGNLRDVLERKARAGGGQPDQSPPSSTPMRLGEYRLIRKIGQGAMGTVYEAIQEGLERRVALKVLSKVLMSDKKFVSRFKREARAVSQLNHPNIVTIFQIGEEDGLHYFSMEFVDGRSLDKLLKQRGKLGVAESLTLITQAAHGLAHAWNCNVVHRDVKPGNLLLASNGIIKIADFGLAKAPDANEALTMTGAVVGTPYYMSPEQIRNAKDVDFRADIYSLGATLFHLVTGRAPFEGESPFEIAIKVATMPTPRVREINPAVPPPIAEMIEKMLVKNPQERFQQANELLTALKLAGQFLAATN